jgi:hypothetical protein
MSIYRAPASHRYRPADPPNQTFYLIFGVVLLLIAGGMVLSRAMATRAEEKEALVARDPQVQIQQIRNNPNMPPQAKAIAEAQITSRQQENAPRAASRKR